MEKKHHYTGLTDAQVLESREKNGVNILTPPKKEPLWKKFIEKFGDPLIIILLIAGVLSVGISCYEYFGLGQDWKIFFEPIGIFIAILLATGLAFIFELKADKEFSLLNQVNDDELIQVIRNSNHIMIAKKDIVVGDIVVLETGNEVPADGELIDAISLTMDESTLTGEPSCMKTIKKEEFDKDATFPSNYVMRGTKVMEGHGVMKVFAVGDKTENGKVFKAVQIDDSIKTPLNEQLDGLSDLITKASYIFAALIIIGKLIVYFNFAPLSFLFIIPTVIFFWLVVKKFDDWSGWKCITSVIIFFAILIGSVIYVHSLLLPGQNISLLLAYTLNTLMIAVTLIVVAVPEGLPMAVTLSLAYSMRRMLKTNNLVRKMHACETMGAATVICTDKTGTLTQNQMHVYETQFVNLENQKLVENKISKLVEQNIAVNSTATLDLSDQGNPQVLGNPTEGALLLWLKDNGVNYIDIREESEILTQLPFTTDKKYMATTIKSNGKRIILVKGAPEIVESMCMDVDKTNVDKKLVEYQNGAYRTLGFAYKELEEDIDEYKNGKIAINTLNFLGIVAISDPIRLDVPNAVKEVLDSGIQVKIVTGDTSRTAVEIGRQIGLWSDKDNDKNIITGPELAAFTDEQLFERVEELKIISRARPMDKKRFVEILQKRNNVVAVTGDGTNDAPALNTAHVGLSMGDGTSVAKEASDITIIDNSFSSIGRAVMWGRSLYQNIQRFLLFQLTVNVAACFLVLFGSFMGTSNPLTVTQMLWVNLIMDTFGAMALSSLPPSEKVMKDKPRDRKAFIINSPMAKNIIGVGGVFFLLLLAMVYVCEHANITCMKDFFNFSLEKSNGISLYEQTLIFSMFVWTHLWYMFCTRSFETGKSVFNLHYSQGFWTIIGIIFIGQILIVEVLFEFFNVIPMKLEDWIIIILGSSFVLWIREIWHLITGKRTA